MAMKIRLARGGSKKRPFYRIVAADSRMPRDGRYVEKLGTYNPLLAKDDENRVQMNMERVNYWLGEGAQPTDRISRFLEAAGVVEKKERANLKKLIALKKRQPRLQRPPKPQQPQLKKHQQKKLPQTKLQQNKTLGMGRQFLRPIPSRCRVRDVHVRRKNHCRCSVWILWGPR